MRHSLSDLPIKRQVSIASVHLNGEMYRRLLDLGFTCGADCECLFAAPSGDPRAYRVRESVFALRNCDARHIIVSE